ncbi:type IA DNA topoisomerase [Polluticaenibacter yanchengensis]|uniref:DNA topoisomerase n=1 Tax=Polluticaenibacter yanchengensis TaxID=3014562 RepID=A0ABT4UPS5_9BACT|nr:DNA topoisomerase 3 [Chitinophagaceae bacterium LY-5]
MKLCIAEKPSVARDIAEVLGAKTKHSGYYEGNGYYVSWTFGHFCTLKEPHDYTEHWRYWSLDHLPIIPPNYGIKLIDNGGVAKQFAVIESLLSKCEEVINCGDAGQEGELIQRWVLLKAKCQIPVKRLWISSLTEDAIKKGFEHLKPSEDYNNLYAAGSARAIGDWLLGINATRLFTKKFGQNKVILSVGRVQTPTLAMIVQRTKEVDAFKAETYFELKTIYRDVEFTATIDRLKTQEKAEKGVEYLKQHLFEITDFEIKEGKEGNPKLFDLTGLQVEANKKLALSAEDTLKTVQNLYEKKFVTYPRVDTTYLSEDLHPTIEGVMQNLSPYYGQFTAPVLAAPIPMIKSVFDNTKVTDHHAIIPTGVLPPKSLSTDEKKVYDMIVRRFIAAFYPECKISNTTVLGMVGQIPFKVTGKQILESGWRVLYNNEPDNNDKDGDKKDEANTNKEIPMFEIGEKGPHEPRWHQGKTSAPKYFTEATLLRAMETAGKQVDDEQMRELMKDNGIGRPSTRANIIETLFKRMYIEKRRKNIIATTTGIELIDTINYELLKSPELTGTWEKKLREIEKGTFQIDTFKQELVDMVNNLTQEVKNSKAKSISVHVPAAEKPAAEKVAKVPKASAPKTNSVDDLQCPKCKGSNLIKGKTAYGCLNYTQCDFKIPFEFGQVSITPKIVRDLVMKQKTGKLKRSGGDNTNDARLVLKSDFTLEVQDV